MLISSILRRKGGAVVTVPPQSTVTDLLALLSEQNIGAVVVSEDGESIAGIVSERDVVRHLYQSGPAVLTKPVSAIMTATVRTCGPDANVEDLRHIMTDHRIRHVPVVDEGHLAGIVSIGDVVKSAIEELEAEKAHLVGYLHG
ncbi:CBS domain-containing protein [Sphaerisporangium aureirubrum]|uniref:CBS domain-containing protein n=1 Tax=Sphaerisporangium aureirubrum TaxID=1544736 RepID=A0ABW1NHN5_9ACTN